jgi:hypothetical protein
VIEEGAKLLLRRNQLEKILNLKRRIKELKLAPNT